jgi:hypothetical protein
MKLKKKKVKINSIVRKKLEDRIKKKEKEKEKKEPQPNISTLKSLNLTPCLT